MNQETNTTETPSILDRITEQDVCDWMKAKMESLRAGKLPGLHYIDMSVHFVCHREPECYCTWGMQASGACAVSEKTSGDAARVLIREIAQHPGAKAAEKKRQAKALLAEAEELEKVAATI